ncbi:MAG TPA: mechanosensitive ion channel family protein [Stenotrophobium sp.]|jgi:MscS family membrane protein|nr:mechanosensitive ion channel family protein [Stenotrophobium sp.]
MDALLNLYKNFADSFAAAHERWGWMLELFLIVTAVVAINLLLKYCLLFMGRRVQRSANLWDDAIYAAINLPLRALTWVIGLSIAAQFAVRDGVSLLSEVVMPARTIGVIAVIIWFLIRLVKEFSKNLIEHRSKTGQHIDHTTVEAIGRLLNISFVITGTLVAMQTLGYSISGVLAFGGVGGLAIGLASKDMLANIFGGLTIFLDRPFSQGDWIRSPEKDIEGVVENIGWRRTQIRTFDKRPLYVPNAVFTNIVVENASRMTHRRINETINLRYNDLPRVRPLLDEIRTMLQAHKEIDQRQTILVNLVTFAPHSVDFMLYCMTVTRDWAKYQEVKQDVLLKTGEIVAKHGADMAFPTMTLLLPEAIRLQQEPAMP